MTGSGSQGQGTLSNAAISDAPSLHGVDISIYLGEGDWQAAANAGTSFAYIEWARGSQAGTFAPNHWKAAADAGIVRGAYQRFFSNLSGAEQAATFVRAFHESGAMIEAGDAPPVLDVEYDDDHGNQFGEVEPDAFLASMHVWVDIVVREFGRIPMVYTSASFWNAFLSGSKEFAHLPLWVAHYNVDRPTLPTPWSSYVFWQYRGNSSVPGIASADLDLFQGTIEELESFIRDSNSTKA